MHARELPHSLKPTHGTTNPARGPSEGTNMDATTTPASTVSAELEAQLRWETSQTDPDKKSLRMIEHHALLLNDGRELRDQYMGAFDGLTTENGSTKMPEILEFLENNPVLVTAARRSADSIVQVTDNARRFVARHDRNRALLTEWIALLSSRYPGAADLIQVAVYL